MIEPETTPNYTWIKTRDGSPTLWNNALGESFRSVKGAFTESWTAFVRPGLARAKTDLSGREIRVGEFGLGVGTNWLLWTLACGAIQLEHEYTAIERHTESFDLGLEHWLGQTNLISKFLSEHGLSLSPDEVAQILANAQRPQIFPSIEAAVASQTHFDIWFHDPFGYDVNPEGYSDEILNLCRKLWSPGLLGASYACNRRFVARLEALPGVETQVIPTNDAALKRERIEFRVTSLI